MSCGYADATQYVYNFTVTSPPITPTVSSPLTASATVGVVMSTYTITAANTPTSYSATGLPAGLSVDTSNGQITGTPTAAGTVSTTIKATNSAGTGSATLVFTIAAGTQAALSLASTSATYGTPFTLTSSGGSGTGAVTFSIDSAGTAGCSLTSSTTLSATSTGDCTVIVAKAADSNYDAATATVSIGVGRATQATVSLTSTRGTFGSVLPLDSSGGSGTGAVSYTVTSPGTAGCSLATSTTLTSTGAGTCQVTATKALDANYTAATSTPTTVTFDPGAQTSPVILTSSSTKTYGSTLTLTASGGTGTGALTYAVLDTGTAACTIVGDQLTSTGDVGTTCTITATRLPDTNYLARASDPQTITVATQATQPTLVMTTPTLTYRTSVTLSATGGSGSGAVTFLVTTVGTAGCSIVAGVLFTTGDLGTTCVIAAYKAGSTNYLQTSSAEVTVSVTAQAAQLIDFTAPADREFSPTPFTVSASSDSGLSVSLTSASPSICSAAGLTVTMLLPGTCLLDANQTGDGNYLPASPVRESFEITHAVQPVTWNPATGATTTASPFTLSTAVGGDGGAVTYSVVDAGTSNCAIADASIPVLAFDAAGSCTLQAQAASTATHQAGTSTRVFIITRPPAPAPASASTTAGEAAAAGPGVTAVTGRTLDPIVKNGGLAPGVDLVTIDGRSIAVRIEANATNSGLDVLGAGWYLSLRAIGPDGMPGTLAPGGILVVTPGSRIDVSGSGFDALSQVRIYLMSHALHLGSLMTDRAGDITGSVAVPADLPIGTDTVQVNGFTKDRMVRSVSLGITVRDAKLPVAGSIGSRIYFRYKSAVLTPKARRSLTSMIAMLTPHAPTVTSVTGAVRRTGATRADRSLATRRAAVVADFLMSHGISGAVRPSVRKVPVRDDFRDRRVDISVRRTF